MIQIIFIGEKRPRVFTIGNTASVHDPRRFNPRYRPRS
jgi:hypothetical protein